MRLTDKVIVITGSTRGIGLAIAKACAHKGAKLVICSRNKMFVENTVQEFINLGVDVFGIVADVSIGNDLKKIIDQTIYKYKRIDVWINNAGISLGYRYIQDISADELSSIVDINIKGTLFASKLLIPYFIEQKGGILINMSGRGGGGEAAPYMAAYCATKAAVSSLTKSLAAENKKHPLSIHYVLPGMVETDFYKDMKISPSLKENMKSLPYILKAFGVSLDDVGKCVAKIASQKPGKRTGKLYSLLGRTKMIKGSFLMMWYGMTGKLRSTKNK